MYCCHFFAGSIQSFLQPMWHQGALLHGTWRPTVCLHGTISVVSEVMWLLLAAPGFIVMMLYNPYCDRVPACPFFTSRKLSCVGVCVCVCVLTWAGGENKSLSLSPVTCFYTTATSQLNHDWLYCLHIDCTGSSLLSSVLLPGFCFFPKLLMCVCFWCCRNTNLSLLDSSGAMVSIDPTMPHNTER